MKKKNFMRNAMAVTCSAAIVLSGVSPAMVPYNVLAAQSEESITLPYKDVVEDSDWFYSYAGFMYSRGIMTGITSDTFGPAEILNRAQFATTLYRMAGKPQVSEKGAFPDVEDGTYFTEAVRWASAPEVNIIAGYEDGTFGPGDSITREQLATMLYRYAEQNGYDTSADGELSVYPDADQVSEFAAEAMKWAVGKGIISGDDGKLNPQGVTNRAVCAAILTRFLQGKEGTVEFAVAGDDSIYAGMPLFDGEPDHLDAYLDTLCDYMGEEGMMRHALGYRGDYRLRFGENAGRVIPGSELFGDHVQGVFTDFPSIVGLGNSWNEDLVEAVGEVIGTENLYTCDFLDTISKFNAVTCTAMQDLRVNPLSGRYDEGFAEDPYMVSKMVDAMAIGASGIAEEGNEDGFWTKCIVTTKHYTNYAGQFFRRQSNVTNSVRGTMEMQARNIKRGIEDGSVTGFMTSYGRTAGIPNSLSPLVTWMQSFAPWGEDGGVYVVTDYSSDWQLYSANSFGNGYDDRYVPEYSQALALMLAARTGQGSANRSSTLDNPNAAEQDAALAELENGTSGLTVEDLEKTAKAQLIPLIRCGVFNERDENGYPVEYPFTSMSANAGDIAYDSSNADHQAVALQAAQESVVLLKNDNDVLPLSKDASVAVAGPLSGARFKTTYAVGKTPDLPNSGLSIGAGMKTVGGEDKVTVTSDGNVVALKASNGKYIVVDEAGKMTASADTAEAASKFEAYAWGQDNGYSFMCVDEGSNNGKWLKFTSSRNNIAIDVTGTENLNVTDTGLTATSYSITLPSRFSVRDNGNQTSSILMNCYSESFFGSESAYGNARVMKVTEDGTITYSDTVSSQTGTNAEKTAALCADTSTQFTVETVEEAGNDTAAANADYAVVVVGAPTRHSAGEGADRSDLYLGADQYELVANVAEDYPGRTIVVINTVFPVIAEEIQKNPNVAAVLYVPYGGQYDGYAAGQTIYGDAVPTGKLTGTWYADMSALPTLDAYSIPEGTNNTMSLGDLAPRYTVDVSQADAAANKLTYQYTDADVTYEFGYGLTYTTFAYSDFRVGTQNEDGSLQATVTVKNTGNTDSSEIVQLYASNKNSTYGDYAAIRRLVAFDKVELKAGESKTVTLTVEEEDLQMWNSNKDSYAVEAGTYTFEVGTSSKDIKASENAVLRGENFDGLNIGEAVSVYDKSFAASPEITYNEYSKAHTAKNLNDDVLVGGYSRVIATEEGAWVALNGVDMDGIKELAATVGYDGEGTASIEVRLDAPDGSKVAEFQFGKTGTNTYTVDAVNDYDVTELAFEEVTADLTSQVSGIHDLYIVFNNADANIYTLQGK